VQAVIHPIGTLIREAVAASRTAASWRCLNRKGRARLLACGAAGACFVRGVRHGPRSARTALPGRASRASLPECASSARRCLLVVWDRRPAGSSGWVARAAKTSRAHRSRRRRDRRRGPIRAFRTPCARRDDGATPRGLGLLGRVPGLRPRAARPPLPCRRACAFAARTCLTCRRAVAGTGAGGQDAAQITRSCRSLARGPRHARRCRGALAGHCSGFPRHRTGTSERGRAPTSFVARCVLGGAVEVGARLTATSSSARRAGRARRSAGIGRACRRYPHRGRPRQVELTRLVFVVGRTTCYVISAGQVGTEWRVRQTGLLPFLFPRRVGVPAGNSKKARHSPCPTRWPRSRAPAPRSRYRLTGGAGSRSSPDA